MLIAQRRSFSNQFLELLGRLFELQLQSSTVCGELLSFFLPLLFLLFDFARKEYLKRLLVLRTFDSEFFSLSVGPVQFSPHHVQLFFESSQLLPQSIDGGFFLYDLSFAALDLLGEGVPLGQFAFQPCDLLPGSFEFDIANVQSLVELRDFCCLDGLLLLEIVEDVAPELLLPLRVLPLLFDFIFQTVDFGFSVAHGASRRIELLAKLPNFLVPRQSHVSLRVQLVVREQSLLFEATLAVRELQIQLFVLLRELLHVPTVPAAGVVYIGTQLLDVVLQTFVFGQQLLVWLRRLLHHDHFPRVPLQLPSAMLLLFLANPLLDARVLLAQRYIAFVHCRRIIQ